MSDLREAAKALLSHWDAGKRISGALEVLRSALAADEVSADLSAALARAEKAEAEARRAITQLDDALGRLQTAHEERDALAARLAEVERDASRYRWLQSRTYGERFKTGFVTFNVPIPDPIGNIMKGSIAQHFDDAIDAALAREEKS